MKRQTIILILPALFAACAPQRQFVRFEDAGIFHPGRSESGGGFGDASTDYDDSYELIDHGAPNHGVPPMYGYPRW